MVGLLEKIVRSVDLKYIKMTYRYNLCLFVIILMKFTIGCEISIIYLGFDVSFPLTNNGMA